MEYSEFLESKKVKHKKTGFEITEDQINPLLFDFQKFAVKFSLKVGKAALFEECGLGKTLQQMEWAKHVVNYTGMPVLILAPLAVVGQTISEGNKFGYKIWKWVSDKHAISDHPETEYYKRTYIINYEQLPNIDTSIFGGVVLDESSILKSKDGKTKAYLINAFIDTQFKLCCSATPSPNDHMELGNHAEFLNVMKYNEMLAMYFVHDGGETSKWRLRKHAEKDFWKFVSSWALSIDKPSTLGFSDEGYELPEINYIEHLIDVDQGGLNLFGEAAVSATELNRDLRKTIDERCNYANELLNGEQCILWGLLNKTTDKLNQIVEGGVNVQGKDSAEYKAEKLIGFGNSEFNHLITKTSIASFGMNYQNCHNMIFVEYDFKFEAFYQAVRRCYRFGQTKPVNVHLIIPKSQVNVRNTILEKERKHKEMIRMMAEHSAEELKPKTKTTHNMEDIITEDYWLMHGDAMERIKDIPSDSVGYSFFSPPFGALYVFSDNERDLSNVKTDDEFYQHFSYLVPELLRIMKPGRNLSMHIMQGTTSIGQEGYYSIKDFRGELIRLFQKHGFIFHAEKMIRKNPQLAAVRTKNSQLMWGQTKRDSAINRPGLADYIITFRKAGENKEPINNEIPFDVWCKLAEPVWTDIDEGNVIGNARGGRDENDERHITPTQLETIKNCLLIWSRPGDTVFSPFGGIGSEGYQALKMGRKSINIELKASYFKVNAENHKKAKLENSQLTLL